MIVCVKETPEVARHVSDVKVSGRSIMRCRSACTSSGEAYDADGRRYTGPVTVYVYRDGLDGKPAEGVALRESDVIGEGKDARINWTAIRSRP